MPNRKIGEDIRDRALYLLSAGQDTRDITAALGVSKRTIHRWEDLYNCHGYIPRSTYLCGRPRKLSPLLMEELRLLIKDRPTLYLNEIVEWFATRRNFSVSISTIQRALVRLGLTYKKLRITASERDEVLRQQWKHQITGMFAAAQLVFADETSKDERVVMRRYGRAPAGERAVEAASTNRGVRYSILPALSLDGILTVRVVRGSVDSLEFLDWVIMDLVRRNLVCFITPNQAGPRTP